MKDIDTEREVLNIGTEQLVPPAVTQARSSWNRKASVLLRGCGLDKFQIQCLHPARGPWMSIYMTQRKYNCFTTSQPFRSMCVLRALT